MKYLTILLLTLLVTPFTAAFGQEIQVKGKISFQGSAQEIDRMKIVYEVKNEREIKSSYERIKQDWQQLRNAVVAYNKADSIKDIDKWKKERDKARTKASSAAKKYSESRANFGTTVLDGIVNRHPVNEKGEFSFTANKAYALVVSAEKNSSVRDRRFFWMMKPAAFVEFSNGNKMQDFAVPPDVENIDDFVD